MEQIHLPPTLPCLKTSATLPHPPLAMVNMILLFFWYFVKLRSSSRKTMIWIIIGSFNLQNTWSIFWYFNWPLDSTTVAFSNTFQAWLKTFKCQEVNLTLRETTDPIRRHQGKIPFSSSDFNIMTIVSMMMALRNMVMRII